MKTASRIAIAAAVVGGAALTAAGLAVSAERGNEAYVLTPGQGVSLDIGAKHAVSYFATERGACALTVVIADQRGEEAGADSPGTRLKVGVMPGTRATIDVPQGKSAEFFCGPGAAKMNARVFDSVVYEGARS